MTDERRRDKRLAVELWVEAEAGDELYFQRAANLSVGGAYFAQTVPQPVGTRVQLRFSLPGDPAEIHCVGEIVAATDNALGMGIRFVELAEADRARIAALIGQ